MKRSQGGFAFSELIVALGIFGVLLGFVTINVLRTQHQSNLSAVVDTLIADVASQQHRAMVGQVPVGIASSDAGVVFAVDRYTLFSGATFNPGDPGNTVIVLPSGVRIDTIALPNATMLFGAGSGEAGLISSGSDSITVTEQNSGLTKAIRWNRLGVVIHAQ